jgi:hypothetical protein
LVIGAQTEVCGTALRHPTILIRIQNDFNKISRQGCTARPIAHPPCAPRGCGAPATRLRLRRNRHDRNAHAPHRRTP